MARVSAGLRKPTLRRASASASQGPPNFAPRLAFAYQVTPKLVVRGGFGIFYNGFENRGFSPNIGENYPFQFNFQFFRPDDNHPIKEFAGCPTAAGAGAGGPTLETG